MKSVISRIIITVLATGLWTVANTAVDATAPLISSKAAMGQLQDTDSGFIIAKWGALVTGGHLSSGLLLLVLLAVWAGPVIKGLKRLSGRTPPSSGSLVALLFVILGGSSCHGYYDARDNEEYVTIKANQTAFLVPQQGANQVVEEFAKIGITIGYVGYASQLNFDKEIQDAINKVFLTKQEAEAAANQLVSIPVRTAIADITIKESISRGLEKWDGRLPALPSFMILTPEVTNSVKSLFPGPAPLPTQLGQPATPPAAAKQGGLMPGHFS